MCGEGRKKNKRGGGGITDMTHEGSEGGMAQTV